MNVYNAGGPKIGGLINMSQINWCPKYEIRKYRTFLEEKHNKSITLWHWDREKILNVA